MRSEWPTTTLGALAEASAFGPRFSSKEYADNGNIACLRTKDISADGRIDFPSMPLAELNEKAFRSHYLQKDDLVITRTGRVGTVAVFTEFDRPVVPGAFLIRYRLRRSVANPWFYRYFFNSTTGQQLIQTVATGSVQQNLNITNLNTLEVPIPPLNVQNGILRILASLDNKIELNRQINTTLESMAQALFKSWFVDFDPVIDNMLAAGKPIPEALQAKAQRRAALGDQRQPLPADIQQLFPSDFVFTEELGWVPEGWEVSTVGEQVETTGGGTPSTKNADYWEYGTHAFCTPKDMSNLSSWVLMDTERHLTDAGVARISSGQLPSGNGIDVIPCTDRIFGN
ncbi:restriction endonuclease subunit S [Gilvimarinus sp. F26214L]|uniref:restriction endonuclease subunit S n=1 Tax=Gilvimarinus sp. DZF01 TaxID=3461371 RepID=UPI0040456E9F